MDGPKLPARASNIKTAQSSVQVYSDNSHEQKPQVSIRMFPQSKNQQTFHCESGFPQGQLASMNFTAA